MVDYKYKDLFYKRNTEKQLKIAAEDGSFTALNSDIAWENFELRESLCSESELRFGSCETSMIKFQIRNAFIPLIGKWLTVSQTLGGKTDEPFIYGRYKVFSDAPTADKEYRDVTAYDSMYDMLNADVTDWYNTILPNNDSAVSMKQFRSSFIAHFGLEEADPILNLDADGNPVYGLINDDMVVEKTIEITGSSETEANGETRIIVGESLSGKDVITAICEINGCFGHIGRDGKFHYIHVVQNIHGIYPADFLFPDHVPEQWHYLPQAETGHLYPQDPKSIRLENNAYIKCKYEDYVVFQINRVQIRKEENDIGGTFPKDKPEAPNEYVIEDNFLVYGKSAEKLDAIAKNVWEKIRGIVYIPINGDFVGNPCLEVGDPIRFETKYKLVETYIFERTLKGMNSAKDSYVSKGYEGRSENRNSIQKSIKQLKGKSNIITRTVEENRLQMLDIEKQLSTEISILAGRFVLKVDAGGKMAIVELNADASTGSEFKVSAENISLSAEEAISLMSGGTLNLTGKNIEIRSDNFNVDTQGNIECRNITAFSISGDAINQFNSAVDSSESMELAMKAIKKAQDSLDIALETIKNLNETIIPEINKTINDLQIEVAGIENRVSALEMQK